MATTVADFRTRFPEFSDDTDFPDARVQLFLDDAANCYMGTTESRWCDKYDFAQAYLAAHLLKIGTDQEAGASSANSGPINSKSAGGVSVTRTSSDMSNVSGTEAWISTTSYGRQYLNIRNTCFVGTIVANQL